MAVACIASTQNEPVFQRDAQIDVAIVQYIRLDSNKYLLC